MKKCFELGKVDVYGRGRKAYPVEVEMELREKGGEPTFRYVDGVKEYTGETTPKYNELSICAYVYNTKHTDCVMGGQCLDDINEEFRSQLKNVELWDKIYNLWKSYHLNSMHAGTPEQEKAIEEWESEGHRYDYTEVCNMLKEKGIYEVNYTGLSVGHIYDNEPYKYGHAWLVETLPPEVEMEVLEMLTA